MLKLHEAEDSKKILVQLLQTFFDRFELRARVIYKGKIKYLLSGKRRCFSSSLIDISSKKFDNRHDNAKPRHKRLSHRLYVGNAPLP